MNMLYYYSILLIMFAVRQPIETHYCPLPSKKKYLVENTAEVSKASERFTPENRAYESSNSHGLMPNVVSITEQMGTPSDLLFDRIFGSKFQSSNKAKRKKIIGNHLSLSFMRWISEFFFFL